MLTEFRLHRLFCKCRVSIMLANNKATSAIDMAREIIFLKSTKWPVREGVSLRKMSCCLLTFLLEMYREMNVQPTPPPPHSHSHPRRVTRGIFKPPKLSSTKLLYFLLLSSPGFLLSDRDPTLLKWWAPCFTWGKVYWNKLWNKK